MAARAMFRRAAAPRLLTVLLAALLFSGPALAVDIKVIDTRFLVLVRTAQGEMRQIPGNKVPLLPGRACYSWGVRLDHPPGLVRFKEIFTLPAPLADWGTDRDFSTSEIINGGRAAVTQRFTTPKDGWVENVWCVGAKDPTGKHSFEVFIDDKRVKTFPFEVVPFR